MDLSRSTSYYLPAAESDENLTIMRLIDAQFLETPFYGRRKWTWWLRECHGYVINPKRVRRLLQVMGIEAVFPGRRTTKPEPGHKKYPYLLRGRGNYAAEPGLEHGHHVRAAATRVHVFGGGDGLA